MLMRKYSIPGSLRLAAFSFLFLAFGCQGNPEQMPPNIIVILVDDAGYADFGFMGTKDLETPHLDKLASDAILFTDAHVSASVCSPSRAGLLSGRYQQRFGYECNEGEGYTGIDTSVKLFPEYLRENGYTTAIMGKWHLGYRASQHPLRMGFDYFYGFLSGSRSYFYEPQKDDRPGARNALLENNEPTGFEGYLTDVLGDKAVSYIRENREKPFFLYWSPNAVHTPMQASEADLERFAGHPRQMLAAMTYALDRAVGKIVDELKKQGLYENTLLFFLSDNGGAHNNQSTNGILKGFKGNEFEAGHRIPFLVSWPKKFKGAQIFGGLSSSLDIAATALEAAGIPQESSVDLDGVSLLSFLSGEKQGDPHPQLIWRKDAIAAVRQGPYKWIQAEGAGERLYKLDADPGETQDLRNTDPQKLSQLQEQFTTWEKKMIAPAWTEGALWDTITLMIHDDLMQNRKVRVRNPEELEKYRRAQSQPTANP